MDDPQQKTEMLEFVTTTQDKDDFCTRNSPRAYTFFFNMEASDYRNEAMFVIGIAHRFRVN
eukprot:scaffold10383_cov44-Cyclotella_meneghiniana.AAC.1